MKYVSSLIVAVGLSMGMQAVMAEPLPLVVQQSQTKIAIEKCLHGKKDCVSIEATYPVTNVEWINKAIEQHLKLPALLSDMLDMPDEQLKKHADTMTLKQSYEMFVSEKLNEIKASSDDPSEMSSGVHFDSKLTLAYQKGAWVIFKDEGFFYADGAAHPATSHDFITYDLNKQKQLTLQDMLNPNSQKKLIALLKETYKTQHSEDYQSFYADSPKSATEDNKLFMTDNFLFTPDGISFYYEPYRLSSYAEGYIHVDLTPDDLKDIIKPEYLK